MLIEVFVLNSNGGLLQILWNIFDVHSSTPLIGEDVVENFTVSIEDFGTKTFTTDDSIG